MSRFKRQMIRGGLDDYQKSDLPTPKKTKEHANLKQYASLSWLVLTPMNVIKMFVAYMVVALTVEKALANVLSLASATVISHGLITSLLVVLLLNGANGKKASLQELGVRYVVMALIFGLGTLITSSFLYK